MRTARKFSLGNTRNSNTGSLFCVMADSSAVNRGTGDQSVNNLLETDVDSVDVTPDIVVSEVDVGRPCLDCGDRCAGFSFHDWRSTCANCKCVRERHDVYNDNFVNVRDRLGWKREDDTSKSMSKEQTLREGFTWVPSNLSSKKIQEYMDQLPNHKVPRLSTQGARYRDIQLIKQLPRQDLSDLYCKFLDGENEKKEFMIFRELRDQVAMGIGVVKECPAVRNCQGCRGEIERGDLVVTAAKLSPDAMWHPACFTCRTCEELLVDLVYCQHSKNLYCQRHYAELIRPRCPGCDEVGGGEDSGSAVAKSPAYRPEKLDDTDSA